MQRTGDARRWLHAALSAACVSACAQGGSATKRERGAETKTPIAGAFANSEDARGAGFGAGSSGGGGVGATPMRQPPAGCGDGTRTEDEACDDGNLVDGDGCDATCLGIEPGFSCPTAGEPCREIARCGDGVVAISEACDDGNVSDGDGCAHDCRLERGFKCDGQPSTCSVTTCGDGRREGTEACDDGNTMPFDGCSGRCEAEPDCSAGACTSACGDGLVLGEACDDGNLEDGDGCSAACEVEDGFECNAQPECEMQDGACILRVPVVYRDFAASHPDFEIGCGELTTGLVETRLSGEGKPVLRGTGGTACISSPESFAQWYTDNTDNAPFASSLTLFDNGAGGFVNRAGPNGERWTAPETFSNIMYGGPGGTGCEMCTPTAAGACYDPCTPWGDGQACCAEPNMTEYDGDPLFFPLDEAPNALPDERHRAKLPPEYGYDGWPFEDEIFPGAPTHNFHFTTEVVHWFTYEQQTAAELQFTGDDDVWVFLNGRLAVDLGGPHVPADGSVTVDASSAQQFDLSPGNVYEIRVFHAERKVAGSTFRLTLTGFDNAPSVCEPICGDGIVTIGEECDDGDNDGGYEQCQQGCVLGPRCGDGIVQEGEDCDDGNRLDGDGCGSSCRELVLL